MAFLQNERMRRENICCFFLAIVDGRKRDFNTTQNNNHNHNLLLLQQQQWQRDFCTVKAARSSPGKSEDAHLKDYLVASAFAGIGGMDRGFQFAGILIVVQIENGK